MPKSLAGDCFVVMSGVGPEAEKSDQRPAPDVDAAMGKTFGDNRKRCSLHQTDTFLRIPVPDTYRFQDQTSD